MLNVKALSLLAAVVASLALTESADANRAGGRHKAAGIHGKITSIDSATQFTITTGGKKNPHTVHVTVGKVTHIKLHNKPGSFQDLKVGDTVKVESGAAHPTLIVDEGTGHRKKKAK